MELPRPAETGIIEEEELREEAAAAACTSQGHPSLSPCPLSRLPQLRNPAGTPGAAPCPAPAAPLCLPAVPKARGTARRHKSHLTSRFHQPLGLVRSDPSLIFELSREVSWYLHFADRLETAQLCEDRKHSQLH